MKQRLLTPGPTPVPEDVLLELARPAFYHRSGRFRDLLQRVTTDLGYVFQTANPVYTLAASGTGGMEAALCLLPARAKVICLVAGRWGERFRNIARALDLAVTSIEVPPGETIPPARLAESLARNPDTAAVCATLCETATGVKSDVANYGKVVSGTQALLVVDAISALGCVECRTDEWGIDLCVAGSQKGLMLPPGLAFVAVSPRAWARLDASPSRAFYFDLKKYRDSLATWDAPFTPAVPLVRALARALEMIRAEGLENILARCRTMSAMAQAGLTAMGLELLARVPAEGMTVARVPAGIDGNALVAALETRHGIKLAGGQDALKGKIIRLAHMGHIDAFDVLAALSALELTLASLGHRVTPGASLVAAQAVLAAQMETESSR